MATVAKTPLIIALGMYLSGSPFEPHTVGLTMLLASALWAALYIHNEACDLKHEQNYRIGTGLHAALTVLPFLICLTAFFLSSSLFLVLLLMTLGQMAYCTLPLRLKRFWWAAPVLSGVVNPMLRLQCGAIWGTHPVPVAAIIVLVCIHLSSAIRTRSLQRERDRNLGYNTAPNLSDKAGALCMVIGLLGANCLCYKQILPSYLMLATVPAAGFSAFAWSGRVKDMSQLRRGWTWFAGFTALIIALLCFR